MSDRSSTHQVTADHFVAGVVVVGGLVLKAAPVLKWAKGLREVDFYEKCRAKGWTVQKFRLKAPDPASLYDSLQRGWR